MKDWKDQLNLDTIDTSRFDEMTSINKTNKTIMKTIKKLISAGILTGKDFGLDMNSAQLLRCKSKFLIDAYINLSRLDEMKTREIIKLINQQNKPRY